MDRTRLTELLMAFPWAEATIVAFAAAWGSMLGSFLNVVAYRVPRGESAADGRSRCPVCRLPIRAQDNLPVIGWLRLRGRCRDCGTAISIRYPLVEAACGVLVALLATTELGTGGRWLLRPSSVGFRSGIDRILFDRDWPLVAAWLLHVAVLVVFMAWSLLDRDGYRVSRRTVGTALAAVAVAWSVVPAIGPEPWAGDGWAGQVTSAALGAVVGWAAGRIAAGPIGGDGLMVVGVAAGWQVAAIAAVVTVVLRGLRRGLAAICLTPQFAAGPGFDGVAAAAVSLMFQAPLRQLARWAWHTIATTT